MQVFHRLLLYSKFICYFHRDCYIRSITMAAAPVSLAMPSLKLRRRYFTIDHALTYYYNYCPFCADFLLYYLNLLLQHYCT